MRSVRAASALTAIALLLSACGTTEPGTSDGDTENASAGSQSGPVSVTDSRGKKVTLDEPADEVVALEWAEAEALVTLDVMPVGVADVKGYQTWVGAAAPLDEGVKDVGTRSEPSIDSIMGLEPDLVIMEEERGPELVKQLEKYVPVVTITGSNTDDNIGQMKHNLTQIATLTGTEKKADEALADFDAALAEGRQRIRDAGMDDAKFAMADGWMEGSTVNIRMFGEGSLMSSIAAELGLRNAWREDVDPVWGLGQTDVEGLTRLDGDVQFFYSASEDDVFAEGLKGNKIWESMPFVKQDQVHKLDQGTWTFGGPLSSRKFIEQVVEALTS